MRHVPSNDQGFSTPGLPPGDYELKVQAPGFSPLTQSLRLEVGQQMVLNLSLKVASVTNVVEVGDIAPALVHIHRFVCGRGDRAHRRS